jgi:hypothetical protein
MAALDAFGRLRTSDCFTTFNYYPSPLSNNTSLDVDVWVASGTGGTQTYNSQNYINMPVSGSGTTYSLRTTKQPMIYQPGKSRLIYMTGVLMTTISTNTTSLMGLFDVNSATPPVVTEGTYFKCNGLDFYWDDVTQSGITSVVQSSWNIDTFNGNGPSGKTLTVNNNANKNFLIVIDQEWLGVGRIRCGFIIDGVIYYAHQFLHDGVAIQYTNTPRLHLSYYIYGATTANTMRQMCSTSISEGGYFSTGRINNISNPIGSLVSVNTSNDRVLLGLRVNSSYPNATFYIKKLNFYYSGGSGKIAQYKVQLFSTASSVNIGTLSGGTPSWSQFFTPSPSYSALEYFFGDGSINVSTPGFIIDSGYLETQTSTSIASDVVDSLETRNLFSSYDTLIITGISSAASTTMGVSVTFIEDI